MWGQIAYWVIMAVVAYSTRPKNKQQSPAATSFQDVDIPIAEEGANIPVLFGTRDIKNSSVAWYGDYSARAIKKKGGKK